MNMLIKHRFKHSIAFVLILVLSSLFTTAVFAATVDDVNNNSLRVGVDVYNLNDDASSYTYENVLASMRRGGPQYYFKIGGCWYDLLRGDINSLQDLQDTTKAVPPAEVRIWRLTNWYVSEDTVLIFEPPMLTYIVEHYQKDVGANTYSLVDTDNLTGTMGAQTEAEAKMYAGYAAQEYSQEEIAADGTIVKIYYDPVMVIGDEIIDGKYVVNRDYIDYAMPKHDIGKVPVWYENQEITDADFLEFKYYTEENGKEITTFDLANGGTTLRVFVEAVSEEYGSFSGYVIFKYRSVTIGKNESYLTIEDALAQAGSGDTVYVKYNTSFADSDVAELVYGSPVYTINQDVTMLLPFSSALSDNLEEKPVDNDVGTKITRDNAYVELYVPDDIELIVDGTLTVNAMRGSAGSREHGFVSGANYAQLYLSKGSRITVGGRLNSLGFIYGEGEVEALPGSTIHEPLFIQTYRGGSATSKVYKDAFPFDQFTVNNIEVDLTVNSGAIYSANAMVRMNPGLGVQYYNGDLKLVGADNDNLIQLTSGYLIKKYANATGKLTLSLHGNAIINDAAVKVGDSNVSSGGKDMPFDGKWHFEILSGSNLSVNSRVMLLPGASMNIEEGASVEITEGGRLTVFDPYEAPDNSNIAYPFNNSRNYYRVAPTSFGYTYVSPARLNVFGQLNVLGGVAGRVTLKDSGSVILDGAETSYDIKYAMYSGDKARVNTRQVCLWEGEGPAISVVADPTSADLNEEITVNAIVKDGMGSPLQGIMVNFSGGDGSWNQQSVSTNQNGIAETQYTAPGSAETTVLNASVPELDATTSVKIDVKKSGSGGCPLIYSYDGEELHPEHEPVPTSANKAFEGISFGTLRKLLEVDGQYQIRVGEDDPSETYVNGVRLYAVEYVAGNDVREMLVDIHGNPHTIGDKVAPQSFIDSGNNEWIGELLTEGKPVAAPGLSMLEQGRYIETYVANFDLPADAADVGKLIIKTQETNLTVDFVGWYHGLIDGCNNVWWLERALQSNDGIWGIIDAIGLLGLEVEVWDGAEWIYQGTVASGSHFFEEFLIPIDLGVLEEGSNEVKVRLKSGAGFVMFEQVSMDFSQDQEMTVYPLDLEQALYNGDHDVTAVVNQINDQRVKMQKGDYLDLFFLSPDLDGGKERGIFVDFTGYYHWGLESKTDPIVDTWDGFTYEEIIDEVLEIQPEAATAVEILEWLFDLTETTLGQSMEYKIEKIYVEHALPWMKENLW